MTDELPPLPERSKGFGLDAAIEHLQRIQKMGGSRRWRLVVRKFNPGGMSGHGTTEVDSIAAGGRPTGRCHLAFQAKDRAMVEAFHKAGLTAGGTDNGAPGERPYHPGYYAAFLLDPDGNNIEAVFHGEAERSADSVVVTFEG